MAARDIGYIAVVLFGLGIGFLMIHSVLNGVVDTMLDIEEINASAGAVTGLESVTAMTNKLDYVLFGIFMGLVFGLIITGWFIGGNPIFMFIYFIVVVITTSISALMANVWETFYNYFETSQAAFPITSHILNNLPVYIAIVGFIGIVVMFAKPYLSGDNDVQA